MLVVQYKKKLIVTRRRRENLLIDERKKENSLDDDRERRNKKRALLSPPSRSSSSSLLQGCQSYPYVKCISEKEFFPLSIEIHYELHGDDFLHTRLSFGNLTEKSLTFICSEISSDR